jgi:hypothetical protein
MSKHDGLANNNNGKLESYFDWMILGRKVVEHLLHLFIKLFFALLDLVLRKEFSER